jgi:hypothetical protein
MIDENENNKYQNHETLVNSGMQIFVDLYINMERGDFPVVNFFEENSTKSLISNVILDSFKRASKEVRDGIVTGLAYMSKLDNFRAQRAWDSRLMPPELAKDNPALIYKWTLDIIEEVRILGTQY